MVNTMYVSATIDVLCMMLLLTVIIYYATGFGGRNKTNTWYLWECISTFLYVLSDLPGGLFQGLNRPWYPFALELCTFMNFLATPFMLLFFIGYTDSFISAGTKMSIKIKKLVYALIGIDVILVLITPFTELFYYIDETNYYHRADGYIIHLSFIIVLMLLELGIFTYYRRSFSKSVYITICSYIGVIFVGYGVQLVWYGISAVSLAITYAVLLAHFVIQTQLQNRYIVVTEALKEEADKASMENQAKSSFLASMSHEIRTPINAILGMDTMILRESQDATIREYAMNIRNAGRSLLSLINDILDFSKIESGKMELVEADYRLAHLVSDVKNMMSDKAESKGLKLNILVDKNIPSVLYGDELRIKQIMINIINNAVKYTETGSVTLTIKGHREKDNYKLHVMVKDTGIGIKEEDVPKLFAEYQRIEESKTYKVEGTGLGLAITVNLLALMGAQLDVNSKYGEGTLVQFMINQPIVDEEPIGDWDAGTYRDDEYVYQVSFAASRAKILLVDDNAMNRNVCRALLKQTKVQITEAGSGVECLACCDKEKYDLIFLDHMMPGLDGCETLKQLKEKTDGLNAKTPVVVLTANAVIGAKEYYFDCGFDGYITKPIEPEELEKMIVRFLPEELLEEVEADVTEEVMIESIQEALEGLPEIMGVRFDLALVTMKDPKILVQAIHDFIQGAQSEREKLELQYQMILQTPDEEQADCSGYRIQIHSMKSSAAMIGATLISDFAQWMEDNAKKNDVSAIKQWTQTFLGEWDVMRQRLTDAFEEKRERQEADDARTLDCLIRMEDAIGRVDIDEIDAISDELDRFVYPQEQQVLIDILRQTIFNFDYSGCGKIIFELRKLLDV